MKIMSILVAAIIFTDWSAAQNHSFIYIQDNATTPFYVKMDGVMMPRYSKNYNILSELSPGLKHLTIVFEQNKFPPRSFAVLVPANGFRSLLLDRKNEDFVLYDLAQKKYLPPDGDSE